MAAPAAAAASEAVPVPSGVSCSVVSGITLYNNYEHHLESIPPQSHPEPLPLREWVATHAKAAGSTQYLYEKDAQFKLQVRRGPLSSPAFHVQSGEEWVYVMEGAATLRVIDGREVRAHALPEGQCYLIPGGTPKSLQVAADACVLVLTRERKTAAAYPHYNKQHTVAHLTHHNNNAKEPLDEADRLLWLCGKCGAVAHEKEFHCTEYSVGQSNELEADFRTAVQSGRISCAACKAPYTTESLSAGCSSTTPLPASARAFPAIDPTTHMPPYHLLSWVESHRHLLAPPVGNHMIHGRCAQFKVMIVGGPNERTDYHIDDGEEWFLMLRGDMTLKVVDGAGTKFRDIVIREGESFLLPANVPHSPQRQADTIGLVIERERFSYELDGLRWYCANPACRVPLHTFSFKCADLGTQLKLLIEHWYDASPEAVQRRTCKRCGTVETKPDTLAKIKQYSH